MKTAAYRQILWTLVPAKAARPSSPKAFKARKLTSTTLMATSKHNLSAYHKGINPYVHPKQTPATPSMRMPDRPSGPAAETVNPADTQPAPELATTRISRSIETRAPLWTVYDTWTRFEAFPHFMKGVSDARGLLNESRMVWRIRTGENHVPLEAEVHQQKPFQKIAWSSVPGHPHPNTGEVTFEAVNNEVTRITALFDFDLSGNHDWQGDPIPSATQCLDWSLQCFRSVVESHVDPECESFACHHAAVA